MEEQQLELLEFVGGSLCGTKYQTPTKELTLFIFNEIRFKGVKVGEETYLLLKWKKTNKNVLFLLQDAEPDNLFSTIKK